MYSVVETFLRQQLSLYSDLETKMKSVNSSRESHDELELLKVEITGMEKKLESLSVKNKRVYDDFADGLISEEDYLYARQTYQDEMKVLNIAIDGKK